MMVFIDTSVVLDAHPEVFRNKDPERTKQSIALLHSKKPLYIPFWVLMEILGSFSFVESDLEKWLDNFYERFSNIVPLFPETDEEPSVFGEIIDEFFDSMMDVFKRKFYAGDAAILLQIENLADENAILVTWDKKHFLSRPTVSETVRFMTPKTFLSEYAS